jgi:hypothetical protein
MSVKPINLIHLFNYVSIKKFLEELPGASIQELCRIPPLGPTVKETIFELINCGLLTLNASEEKELSNV